MLCKPLVAREIKRNLREEKREREKQEGKTAPIAVFCVYLQFHLNGRTMKTTSTPPPLETPVPARGQGYGSVLSLTLAPMPRLRVGFVGLGARGCQAVRRWCHLQGVEITALCDASRQATEEGAQVVEQAGRPRPTLYWGEKAYGELCRRLDVHLVYICTDWLSHTPIALEAMAGGKCVAMEVPAATALSDIGQRVDAAERSRLHCMMLENSVYDHFEMSVRSIAQAGLFGHVVHVEGGYAHPIGERWTAWRMAYNQQTRGDLYPTHGLAPACQLLGIHRTDRLERLVAMDTAAFSGSDVYRRLMDRPCNAFANGDQTSTLIRTAQGKTISLQHNVMTPRPYSRFFQVVGTQGYAAKYPAEELVFSSASAAKLGLETGVGDAPLTPAQREKMLQRFRPPFSEQTLQLARQLDSRGGMSFLMDFRLAQCLQQGLPLDMDVYDLAEWCCVAELSRLSIEQGSVPVSVPDFTRGALPSSLSSDFSIP